MDVDTIWVLDSGVNHHLTIDATQMEKATPYTSHDGVTIGNRYALHIE